MARKKSTNKPGITSPPKPPETLADAEVYLSKPSIRQILDFYAISPYLYETAWAYRSMGPSSISDLLDDSKPEDILRALPSDDILEIHDVLNVEQYRPGVIQWDEVGDGEVENVKVDHWITAEDIRNMSKLYNKSNVSEALWAQAILGLSKEVVGMLFTKAKNKGKARKIRAKRKMKWRNKMKKERANVEQPAQDAVPSKPDGAKGPEDASLKAKQTEELALTVTNKVEAAKKTNKRRLKKRKVENGNEEDRGSNNTHEAKEKKAEEGNVESVNTKPSYIPPAQTENKGDTGTHIAQQEENETNSKAVTKTVSSVVEDARRKKKKLKRERKRKLIRLSVKAQDEKLPVMVHPDLKDDNPHNPTCKKTSPTSSQNDIKQDENDQKNNDDDNDNQQDDDEYNDQHIVDQQDDNHEGGVQLIPSPLPTAQPLSSSTPPSTPLLSPTTLTPRITRSSNRIKSPLKSPYFARLTNPKSTPSPRRTPKGTSSIPFPALSAPTFGLIQEALAHNPYHLLLAVQFLNKTRGSVAIPVIHTLIELYPTPADLAVADPIDIVPVIRHLGLQNQRAKKLVAFAKTWVACPPERGKRYRTLDYPRKGAGKGIKKDEVVPAEEEDKREGAWEVAHLPGVGAYAIDSWRIFCRDVVRGVAEGWDGERAGENGTRGPTTTDKEEKDELVVKELNRETNGQNEVRDILDSGRATAEGHDQAGFEPEWQRTLPLDKELRAFLRWMWLKKYNLLWNPITGKTTPASIEVLEEVERGGVVEELDADDDVKV